MEKGILGLVTTILSNLTLVLLGSFYLLYQKPPQHSGTLYMPTSSISKTLKNVYQSLDSEIIGIGGQDAFLYLSLLRSLVYLLLLYSFIGLLGLIPVYNQQSLPASTTLSQFSIEVMNSQDLNMLIPAICILLFSVGIYFLTYFYYKIPSHYPFYFPRVFTI